MLEYLHWTPNANLLVLVLTNLVSIYWTTLISWNMLLEKYKSFAHLRNWLGGPDPLSCPWA